MMFSAVRAEAGGMMAAVQRVGSKWLFTREQLENTPSRRCGVEPDRELSYRQQAANLVQDMGQRLNIISPTTLFLAAKVEEQPRKLEHVIKVAHACLNPNDPPLDTKSNAYLQQAQELVLLETIVLQTLVVACVCIHLACKWSNWEIPVSSDEKHWWEYVDRSVTLQLLDDLTNEFLQILEKTPSKLKRIRNWRANQAAKKPKGDNQSMDGSFQVPSLSQESSLMASLCDFGAGVYAEPSSSFPLDTGLMSLNGLSTLQSSTLGFPAPIAQSTDAFLALQGAPVSKHGHGAAVLGPQKLTLEKYREKHAAELEQKRRHEDEGEPHRKHSHLSSDASSSRVKYSQVQERPSKSGSLKRRHPDSAENGLASQEELKMKIKVSSESSKGRHSPRSGREKHREHSSHKSRSESSHGSHHHHHHHHHHHSSKTHRSSKSHSSSAPVNQALGHAHLAKIDRRPGEGQSSEGNAALINNGPHMDYEDTFNMLDSLLNAHNF
ncbi:Cyclin-T2 [Triplophysa tibetana]|uniref:Cyclin-T2 n=1 Tax=Triplophysa tibetana TaxID=1572043 RepID=A0A5A9NSU5_9TELE|nr:Cyclin-T2 [Triplophysa tibetana]